MIHSETLEILEWHRLCQHLSTFTATKLGAIAIENLQIPLSLFESKYLLSQTKEIYELDNRLLNGLPFEGVKDIGDSLERSEIKGILTGEELLAIATTLAAARNIRRIIGNHPDLEVLNQLVADLRTYPELEKEIHLCIDEQGGVTDRASQKLAETRQNFRKIRSQIHQNLQNILQVKSNSVQEQIFTQRGDRFVIPVKASHKENIRGIVHDISTSGMTLYIEPNSIVSMGNELRTLAIQEKLEEERIRFSLTEHVANFKTDLEKVLVTLTILDMANAKARYSLWLEATSPRILDPRDQEILVLQGLRHPLLIWQQQYEGGTTVVPIDLLIKPEIKVVTITGPNTGGKTVTLKTLGLVALMAKVGLFIPAKEPVEIPWFDQILVDIGDEQSLQQSLSTFSGHICRIIRILNALSEKSASLVLLDEVGAGTDPVEGNALAIALLQYLADNAQLTIATTHFGELKSLKYEDERFENASVEFDEITLSPTYRLLWGIPGRSNALMIASHLGLKLEIIKQAESKLVRGTNEVNQVIAGLEAQRRSQETKADQLENLLKQAELLYKEVNTKANSLEEREKILKESQEIAVQRAISQAKGEIAQVIHRLQQGTPTAQEAQEATNALQKIAEKFILPAIPKTRIDFIPKVGDRIRIPKLSQTAEVITVPNENCELNVRIGIMKMTVKLADIESLDGKKSQALIKEQKNRKVNNSKQKTYGKESAETTSRLLIRTSKNTFDIRGKRVTDAEMILEKVITETTGIIWIIHGHGTGKLRQGIQEFLHRNPKISHFETAPQKEGGTGVTIAHIR